MEQIMRVHVWISGRVQGVFFRQETYRRSRSRGLAGWVANLPDGRVEAVFEGPKAAVESMLRWSQEGPRQAVVTSVEVAREAPVGEESFQVR
ncbi:MAG: acylphosphatase [Actinomycetota bacterium]